MDALVALAAVGGFAILVWVLGRWTRRRSNELDDYFEREDHRGPSATDVSSWPGGRGIWSLSLGVGAGPSDRLDRHLFGTGASGFQLTRS